MRSNNYTIVELHSLASVDISLNLLVSFILAYMLAIYSLWPVAKLAS